MELKLQLLLLLGSVSTLVIIINMIRKERLELKYSLLWILMSLSITCLSLFPKSIELIADLMGVVTHINAIFFLGLTSNLIICFSLTISESRKSKKIKELTHAIALLENKLSSVEIEVKKVRV